MGARWRGSGHGYYFLLRKFFEEKPKNCSQNAGYFFQAARRVENRHAGTGEGISSAGQDLRRRRVSPPLASLVGLRSRTLTFFFFCSLILPFLVVFLVLGCVSRAE